MNKEEIEELKDFTIDLTDIDELALGLEVCSKKSNMVIQEFADTIIQLQQENEKLKADYGTKVQVERDMLQQENKILKENAENNDKVVDKVNWENMLLKKENKELKQKYENAVADYETTMAEKNELKKQLEEYKATNKILSHELTKDKVLQQDCLTTCCGIPIGEIPKLITQQKEFIEYLEDEYTKIQSEIEKETNNNVKYFKIERRQTITGILQKYRSIIGCDK